MKNKELKNLNLNKQIITKLQAGSIKGGEPIPVYNSTDVCSILCYSKITWCEITL